MFGLGDVNTSNRFSRWDVPPSYNLKKILGKGSYGEVAEATCRRSNGEETRCAIKQMERIFDEKTDAKRAYREIHILRQLNHPFIISLYDVCLSTIKTEAEGSALLEEEEASLAEAKENENDGDAEKTAKSRFGVSSPLDRSVKRGDLYLVFEYMDTDLQKIMRSDQFMSMDHVNHILYQILVGIKYLHSANVIHRDLKPANVLINCSDCSIKIADFGLSRVVQKDVANGPAAPQKDADIARDSSSADRLTVQLNREDATSSNESAGLGPTVWGNNDDSEALSNQPPPKPKLSHSLTRHVVTRWYRAPEVILSLPYSGAVDIWSIGCIYGELLGMIKENCPESTKRDPLFPGESCGDLSDDLGMNGTDVHRRRGREQLDLILAVIGTPAQEKLQHLDVDTREYISTHRPRNESVNLPKRYPATEKEAIELLESMLLFSPADRINVDECLAHPTLAKSRISSVEIESENPMESEIETEGEQGRNLFANVIREVLYYRQRGSPRVR